MVCYGNVELVLGGPTKLLSLKCSDCECFFIGGYVNVSVELDSNRGALS